MKIGAEEKVVRAGYFNESWRKAGVVAP
jgi:hypothetical protein